MKLFKSASILFLVMSIMLMSVAGVYAAGNYTDDQGIVYTLNDNGTATVATGSASSATGDIVIPSTITVDDVTYTVTGMATKAFYGNKNITSVVIPGTVKFASVTSPESIFTNCANLNSATLEEGVNYITKNMFSGCSYLTEITVPSSVIELTYSALNNCTRLEKITFLGNDINFTSNKFSPTKLGANVTDGSKIYVQNKTMADNIKNSISNANATATYPKLYSGENIIMEKNVTVDNICYSVETNFATPATGSAIITGNTLDELDEAVDVVIPSAVTVEGVSIPVTTIKGSSVSSNSTAGDGAFYKASNLKSISLPEGLTSIGKEAFYSCINLISANVPSTVRLTLATDTGIFKSCTKLTDVELAEGLNCIPLTMFYGCNALEAIVIPASVEQIASTAFQRSHNLTSITLCGDSFSIVDKNGNPIAFTLTGAESFGSEKKDADGNAASSGAAYVSRTKFYVISDTAKAALISAGVSEPNIVFINMVLGFDTTKDKPIVTINDASDLADIFTVIVAVYDADTMTLDGNVKTMEYNTSDFTVGTAKILEDFNLSVAKGKLVKVFAFDTLTSAIPLCLNYAVVK